ncbi:glucokinase [Azoarcus indigens]|uniref:Glucokinase n=1 Tax=Azoarcus indigens TaxID=29545 RepID=A0A4R6DI47_9RHOO|nr:glucokinase [Azoarcus indigens]NMG67865.1 glucokinase [Azoarcus indigens]TDN43768.1 glucokinase [Azoarcus indigens]
MEILAADIGGSRARLLIGDYRDGRWTERRRTIYPSGDFADLDSLLLAFLQPGDAPQAACLALAGPLENGRLRMTNLPWTVDAADLAARFKLRRLRLINDFAAQALGLPDLPASSLCTLQAGRPQADAPRLLIGAGTGLGVAQLVGDSALQSEGGHAGFAPADAEQDALLQHLRASGEGCSLETLLSGRGLARLHRYAGGRATLDAPAIGSAALAGEPAAAAAAALFARIYAATAGNLALTTLAHGGVYLCGGIAPRLLPFLQAPAVLQAFRDKPPMQALLGEIPLHVVTDDLLGLYGAARGAAQLAAECLAGDAHG